MNVYSACNLEKIQTRDSKQVILKLGLVTVAGVAKKLNVTDSFFSISPLICITERFSRTIRRLWSVEGTHLFKWCKAK